MYEYNGNEYSIEDIEQLAQESGYDDYTKYLEENPEFVLNEKNKVEDPGLKEFPPGEGYKNFLADPASAETSAGSEINMVSNSEDGSLDLQDPKNYIEAYNQQGLDEVIEAVQPAKYDEDFPKFSDFEKTSNEIIAEQYQDRFFEDGFMFSADNNFITVTAPNQETARFATQQRKSMSDFPMANRTGYRSQSEYYEQGVNNKNITAQDKIDKFIQSNQDDIISDEIKIDQNNLSQSFKNNIEDLAVNYAQENNVAVDERYPLASIRNNDPEAYAEIKKQMLDPKNQLFQTGLSEAQQDVLYGKTFDSLINTEAIDYSKEQLSIIKGLQDEGLYEGVNLANKENHISTITNKNDKAAALSWANVLTLKKQLDQATAGDSNYLTIQDKLKTALTNAEALFKQLSGDAKTQLYDPETLQRVDQNTATEEQRMGLIDYSTEYGAIQDKVADVLKQNSFETTTNHYNAHNTEYMQWFDPKNGVLSKTYDLEVTGQYDEVFQKLRKLGYVGEEKDPNVKSLKFKVKDVKLKDLMSMYNSFTPEIFRVGQNDFTKTKAEGEFGSFDELLQAQENSDLDGYIDSVRQTTLNLNAEHDAWKNLYLLNIDPSSIYKSNVSLFFEGALDATFGSDFTERTFGKSDSKILADIEGVVNNMNANLAENETEFNLTEDQKENFETTFSEELVNGLGGFVPMVAEFAAINYVTGGTASALGLTKALSKLSTVSYINKAKGAKNSINSITAAVAAKRAKKAGTTVKQWAKSKGYEKATGGFFAQTSAHLIRGLMEEGKMQMVQSQEMPVGAGVGFYIGGRFAGKLLPQFKFKGEYAALNGPFE